MPENTPFKAVAIMAPQDKGSAKKQHWNVGARTSRQMAQRAFRGAMESPKRSVRLLWGRNAAERTINKFCHL